MILTSKEALELLNKQTGNPNKRDYIINHMITVGNAAGRLAKALKLDEDKAKTLGYIHDIGKFHCEFIRDDGALTHGIAGYKYLKELGYDEEYIEICITHSYLNNDIKCVADINNTNGTEYDFQRNYVLNHEYSIYDKIINICDLMCTDKILTVEKRLIDILIRHGIFENTHYHLVETMKLKKYFDELLGHDLYDLFPEIKENL